MADPIALTIAAVAGLATAYLVFQILHALSFVRDFVVDLVTSNVASLAGLLAGLYVVYMLFHLSI